MRSRVSASKLNHIDDRELRAYGSAGSYVARATDVQAQAVFAGRRPVDEGERWGYDAAGALGHAAHRGRLRDRALRAGRLPGLLHPVRGRLRGDGEFPVPAEQAVHTLEVLDAARTSAERDEVVRLSG